MTSNSVCSSTAGAASATEAAAPGPAAAAGAKAAAVTPSSVCSQSTRFRASSRVSDLISLPSFSSFAVSTAARTAREDAEAVLGRTRYGVFFFMRRAGPNRELRDREGDDDGGDCEEGDGDCDVEAAVGRMRKDEQAKAAMAPSTSLALFLKAGLWSV